MENKIHFLLFYSNYLIRKFKFIGSRPIAPQLLSSDQNNLQIRDPYQISGGKDVFLMKDSSSFFAIFGYFLWTHKLYLILQEDHENRVLFSSAQ
jgi:hypothetical protein